MIQWDQMPLKWVLFQFDFDVTPKQPEIQTLSRRQLLLVEVSQLLQEFHLMKMASLDGRQTGVGPVVVVPLVTQVRCKRRRFFQPIFPFFVKQLRQPFTRSLSPGRARTAKRQAAEQKVCELHETTRIRRNGKKDVIRL